MYLVIAEKPSVSRAIAEVIGAQEREDGYLRGTDCMVSWCFGHLVEYVSPDVYRRNYLWCSTYSFNWIYSPNRNSIKKEF